MEPFCYYFAFNERNEGNNGCYLKGNKALGNIVTRQSVTFGPKVCPSKGVLKYMEKYHKNLAYYSIENIKHLS